MPRDSPIRRIRPGTRRRIPVDAVLHVVDRVGDAIRHACFCCPVCRAALVATSAREETLVIVLRARVEAGIAVRRTARFDSVLHIPLSLAVPRPQRCLVVARQVLAIIAWHRRQVGARQVDDHVVVVIIQPSLSDRHQRVVARGVFREVLVERDLDVANAAFPRVEEHVLDLADLRPIGPTNVPATRIRLVLWELEVVEVSRMYEAAATGGVGAS
jgi:hypothetical protein